jgi:hypothetical protein
MTKSKDRPAKIYPWTTVSARAIEAKIDLSLDEKPALRSPSGKVLVPREDVFLKNVLVQVFDSEKRREKAEEVLEDESVDDILAPFLREEPKWAVHCSVTSSMASGVWGLKYLTIGNRGYFYNEPDGEPEPAILGAWEPRGDGQAFRACFVDTYVRVWNEIGLPPCMGEWADGPFEPMLDAVCAVMCRHPEEWSLVVGILQAYKRPEDCSQFDELAEQTAKQMGIPASEIVGILGPVCDGDKTEDIVTTQMTDEERRILLGAFLVAISMGGFPT